MLSEVLTPEQRKAIKVLQECVVNWQFYLCDDVTRLDICYTDFKAFTTQKISYSDLQHGSDWTWNQSNAKKKVSLENDLYTVVQKFNTRKKTKNIPSNGIVFKLWMFSVFRTSDNAFLGIFIWCEKGMPPVPFPVNSANTHVDRIAYCIPELDLDAIVSAITGPDQNSTRTALPTVTLEDLDFLRPFVDAQTALSLGW